MPSAQNRLGTRSRLVPGCSGRRARGRERCGGAGGRGDRASRGRAGAHRRARPADPAGASPPARPRPRLPRAAGPGAADPAPAGLRGRRRCAARLLVQRGGRRRTGRARAEPTRAAAAVHRAVPARHRDGVLAPLPGAGRLPRRHRRRPVHRRRRARRAPDRAHRGRRPPHPRGSGSDRRPRPADRAGGRPAGRGPPVRRDRADVLAGAVLTQAGNPLPLPGLPIDPVLAAGSPVIAEVVERLAVGDLYATFLHPALDAGAGTLLRVTALDCSNETADHLRAAVLLSPEPDLHGLSHHDLEVLGLIVAGWEDDERIAAALNSTTEDVAETVRRGMQLLGTPSRTGLAPRAPRGGVFPPRPPPRAAGGNPPHEARACAPPG